MDFLTWLKQNGKCLLISGPQGCGKTLMAMQLVDKTQAISIGIMDLKRKFNSWYSDPIKFVILEEFSIKDAEIVIPYIANNTMVVERKGENPIEVAIPIFILCTTGSVDLPPVNRRFHVLEFKA